jgi:hypothetical protein
MFRVLGAADGGHFGASELADMACAAFVIPRPRKALAVQPFFGRPHRAGPIVGNPE